MRAIVGREPRKIYKLFIVLLLYATARVRSDLSFNVKGVYDMFVLICCISLSCVCI